MHLKNLFCCCSNLSTVMIRFSAWGAYLLLVPQRRALIFLLRKKPNAQTKTLIFFKNGTIIEAVRVKNIRDTVNVHDQLT